MTDEQKKKIESRVMFLSIGMLVLLIIALILVGVAGVADTPLFPVIIAVFLAGYWIVSDVLSVVWLHSFEGKTDDQKKSYYIYAGMELVGLGGLVYFMVDMKSTTGAIIYICCLFLKKRFRDEFNGVKPDGDAEEADSEDSETGLSADAEAEAIEDAADDAGVPTQDDDTNAGTPELMDTKTETAEDSTQSGEPELNDTPDSAAANADTPEAQE